MKWFPFAILALFTIVCQCTFVQWMAIRTIWPDWMFILAVHYALWGPWPEAPMAAWVLGLLVDLQSRGRIGLHAFAFGAAAWIIMHVRQVVFRDHPLTQILVTLVFATGIRLLVAGYDAWRVPGPASYDGLWWPALFTALYTAAWAPYLHWPLIRLGRWTGLRTAGRTPAMR